MSERSYAPDYGSSGDTPSLDPDFLAAFALSIAQREGRYLVIPRIVKVNDPAAGADWSIVVPGGKVWLLLSLRTAFTTSAIAANRAPAFFVNDGSSAYLQIPLPTIITANQTTTISGSRQLGSQYSVATVLQQVVPLPNIPLVQNSKFFTITAAIDAGDQWSSTVLYVLEVRERSSNERAQYMEDLAAGRPTTDYPGLLLGL